MTICSMLIGWTHAPQSLGQEQSTTRSRIATEVYEGTAVGPADTLGWGENMGDIIEGDLGNKRVSFTVDVTGYTSAQDVEKSALMLETEGQDGLLRSLNKRDLGYFRLNGQPARQVIFAQQSEDENGRTITLLCERWLNSFVEGYQDKTADFPFAYIELSFDKSGKGEGAMFMAASVNFGKQPGNIVGVEDYANDPDLLKEVHPRTGLALHNTEASRGSGLN
jgi:hypothetical protein